MTNKLFTVFTVYFFILAAASVQCSTKKLKGMKTSELVNVLGELDWASQAEVIEGWLKTKPPLRQVAELFAKPGLPFPRREIILEDRNMLEECYKPMEDSDLLYWAPDHLNFDLFKRDVHFWTDILPLMALRSDDATSNPEFKHVLSLAIVAKHFLGAWRGKEWLLAKRDRPALRLFSYRIFYGLQPYIQDFLFAFYLAHDTLPDVDQLEYGTFRDAEVQFSSLPLPIPFNIMAYRNFPLEEVSAQRILTVAMHWKLDCKKIAMRLAPVHPFARKFLSDPSIVEVLDEITPFNILEAMQMEGAIEPFKANLEESNQEPALTCRFTEEKESGGMNKIKEGKEYVPIKPRSRKNGPARKDKKRKRAGNAKEKKGAVKRQKRTESPSPITTTTTTTRSSISSEECLPEATFCPAPHRVAIQVESVTAADPIPQIANYYIPSDWEVHKAALEPGLDFPLEESELGCYDELDPDWLWSLS